MKWFTVIDFHTLEAECFYHSSNLKSGSIFVSLVDNIPAGKAKRRSSREDVWELPSKIGPDPTGCLYREKRGRFVTWTRDFLARLILSRNGKKLFYGEKQKGKQRFSNTVRSSKLTWQRRKNTADKLISIVVAAVDCWFATKEKKNFLIHAFSWQTGQLKLCVSSQKGEL